MTSRDLTILGFAALFAAAAVLVVASHLRRDRLATVGEVLARLGRRRIARLAVLAVWAWLGWHFLAR